MENKQGSLLVLPLSKEGTCAEDNFRAVDKMADNSEASLLQRFDRL